MRHVSPDGHGTVGLQSCRSLVPHSPCWHCVDVTRNPLALAQHTLPAGHVSAVHETATPTQVPPGAWHVAPVPPPSQQICGGLQTA
jgi:hypothetical protein